MELKEVLEQVPGLRKRFVHYLEGHGYIQPHKIPKQRIARRDYSSRDLALIADMWRYCQQGFSVQAAYDMVARRERCIAYVTFPVSVRKWGEAIERLKERREVLEASAVYGDEVDFVVKTDTAVEAEVYELLMPILGRLGTFGAPTVLRTSGGFATNRTAGGRHEEQTTMRAYVLMKVPGKDVERVMDELRTFPEVVEASTVYGEEDIVLKIAAPDQETLDDLVMNKLHGLEGVESTRTFIGVSKLHWSREAVPA